MPGILAGTGIGRLRGSDALRCPVTLQTRTPGRTGLRGYAARFRSASALRVQVGFLRPSCRRRVRRRDLHASPGEEAVADKKQRSPDGRMSRNTHPEVGNGGHIGGLEIELEIHLVREFHL